MIVKKMLPFNNVAASSVASREIELGNTINKIILKLGGTTFTRAHITAIKCKLNGKTFYEITGTYLNTINTYRGLTTATTYLSIDFTEPFAKTLSGMYLGGIGTLEGVRDFTIEVTIGAATAPTLEGWTIETEGRPLGLINCMISHPISIAAAGKFPITLPHGPEAGIVIERVHFFHTNMTALEVKKNGIVIFENLLTADWEFIAEEKGHTFTAGHYPYDPVFSYDMSRGLRTDNARTMQFNVTTSAADTINCYVEGAAYLQNI